MGLSVDKVTAYLPKKKDETTKTLCIIKPELYEIRKRIKQIMQKNGFQMGRTWKGIVESGDIIEQHYAEHKGKSFYDRLVKHMSHNNICVIEVKGDKDVVTKFREFVLEKLRPMFVHPGERTLTGIHASENLRAAKRELKVWDATLEKAREDKAARKAKSKSIDTKA